MILMFVDLTAAVADSPDEHSGHRNTVPFTPPSPGFIAGGCYGIVRREFSRVFQASALSRRRLAVRKSVPGDRRVRAVEITPQGLELFDVAHVAAVPLAEGLAAGLRPGEAEQLTDLLTRFTSHAEE